MIKKIAVTVFGLVCLLAANAQVDTKSTPVTKNSVKSTTTNVQSSTTETRTETQPSVNSTNGSTNSTTVNTQEQPVKKKLVRISSNRLNAVESAPVEKKSSVTVNKDLQK